MGTWASDEMARLGAAEQLRISTLRRDGAPRRALPVWVVRHGDDLSIRSANGRDVAWFRGVRGRHEGHVGVAGMGRAVRFVETRDAGDAIDAAYRAKYRRYPGIAPRIVRPEARAATLNLVPRPTE